MVALGLASASNGHSDDHTERVKAAEDRTRNLERRREELAAAVEDLRAAYGDDRVGFGLAIERVSKTLAARARAKRPNDAKAERAACRLVESATTIVAIARDREMIERGYRRAWLLHRPFPRRVFHRRAPRCRRRAGRARCRSPGRPDDDPDPVDDLEAAA